MDRRRAAGRHLRVLAKLVQTEWRDNFAKPYLCYALSCTRFWPKADIRPDLFRSAANDPKRIQRATAAFILQVPTMNRGEINVYSGIRRHW